jgi:hypothetical protein
VRQVFSWNAGMSTKVLRITSKPTPLPRGCYLWLVFGLAAELVSCAQRFLWKGAIRMGGTGVDLVQRLVDGDGAEGQSSEAAC